MNINCANKNLEHVGGYWEVKKETKFVKISFAGNEMPTLEAMPQTDAVVEIVLTRCNIRYLRPSLFADTPNVKFVDLSYNALPGGCLVYFLSLCSPVSVCLSAYCVY